MKICIDAGHGGKDSGATNGSLYEKDVNLDIAKKLNALCLLAGFETTMTRENDIYHSPAEKAEKANLSNADIFISIHCNSAVSVLANGTETLVYSSGEETVLGEAIQTTLISRLELKDRGVKQRPDLIVLNSTKMTAVLIEVAFISNPSEKVLLANEDFRQNTAQAIFEGILSYSKKGEDDMTTEEAVLKLKEKGILQSPEYWINVSNSVPYLPDLLKNMANALK